MTMQSTTPVVKRRGGRRHTDRCLSCGYQVARGQACKRCPAVKPSDEPVTVRTPDAQPGFVIPAPSKSRISALLMGAAMKLQEQRPDLGVSRIAKGVMLALDLNGGINPAYKSTRLSCHCPDITFSGANRGSLALCKHSIAVRLAQAANGGAAR